jgi:hypothetical protein
VKPASVDRVLTEGVWTPWNCVCHVLRAPYRRQRCNSPNPPAHCTNLRLPYIFPSAPRRLHRSARPPTRAGVIRPIPSSVHLGWIRCCTTSFCQLPVPPSLFLLSILLSPHRPHCSARPPTRAGLIRPIPLSVHLGWIRCCTPATFSARGPLVFKFQSSRFRCSPLVSIILTFGT